MAVNPRLTITVTPAGRGKFIAHLDGRALCHRTFSPFLAAVRTLAAEGYDPASTIIMRHKGSNTDALSSTIGQAAGLSVRETQTLSPRFERYTLDTEQDGAETCRGPGEDSLNGIALPLTAFTPNPASEAAPLIALSSA
jgi:hypothetical protein